MNTILKISIFCSKLHIPLHDKCSNIRNSLTKWAAGSKTARANMADLREPFELCKILQNDSLLGISRHTEEDHILVTFSDRGVLVYNVSNA